MTTKFTFFQNSPKSKSNQKKKTLKFLLVLIKFYCQLFVLKSIQQTIDDILLGMKTLKAFTLLKAFDKQAFKQQQLKDTQ